jgi:hypothetical protein
VEEAVAQVYRGQLVLPGVLVVPGQRLQPSRRVDLELVVEEDLEVIL